MKDIVTHLLNSLSFDPAKLELVVFPGLLHMSLAFAMLHEPVKVGAQNVSRYDVGPYTGEVAAAHIKDYGIEWVIVGHQDRRQGFKEGNEVVKDKLKQARDYGLNVVLCIGESLEEREQERTQKVLGEQLAVAVEPLRGKWDNVVICYEPVWAIGTGKIASAD